MKFPPKYRTVYADPPWPERGAGKVKRGADKHYSVMKTKDIAGLPVGDLAADDAHLYLRVTNNYMLDGFRVMDAWGFRYITAITWIKTDKFGLGQYFHGNTEHCLFGVRGRVEWRKDIHGKRLQGVTGFIHPRGKHSEKPAVMRSMIERVSHPPYIELFARRAASGWDAWGNEARRPTEDAL